jgi:hypothetical protein
MEEKLTQFVKVTGELLSRDPLVDCWLKRTESDPTLVVKGLVYPGAVSPTKAAGEKEADVQTPDP